MPLRERCKAMLDKLRLDGMLRQNSPVDELMAFVLAEKGRAGQDSLEETMPLVVYFGTEEDREEFRRLILEAKPGMVMKRMP